MKKCQINIKGFLSEHWINDVANILVEEFLGEIILGVSTVTQQSLKCWREVFPNLMIANVNSLCIAVNKYYLSYEGELPKKTK